MRISDWSSDVCSSDLKALGVTRNSWVTKRRAQGDTPPARVSDAAQKLPKLAAEVAKLEERGRAARAARDVMMRNLTDGGRRTEEHRVGKECVRTRRSRGSACNKKKKHKLKEQK